MRRLLLLRHAKAERATDGGRDRERTLTDRGRGDARKIGSYLARHDFIPDRALVSTAARTRETWSQLAGVFGKPPPASFQDQLYNASDETILDAIRQTKSADATLLVIGHNPAMHELAATLVASGDIDARERLNEEFPTAALAVIGFAGDDWSSTHPRGGRLLHFVTPKLLEPND